MSGSLKSTVKARLRRMVSWAVWLLRPRWPWAVVEPRVRRSIDKAVSDPARREAARAEMEHLLGGLDEPVDIESATSAHIEHWMWCEELRWHPRRVTRQPVEGIDNLKAARALGRGVFLSFVHHAHYDGAFASVARHGVPMKVLMGAQGMRSPGPTLRQHHRVVAKAGSLLSAAVGTAGLVEQFSSGEVVAAAFDVPGSSVASLAGRQRKCSSGPVRAAYQNNTPVVLMTSHRAAVGSRLELSEALMPADFASPEELLAELVRRHEGPLLEWPEVAYVPLVCWSAVEE